MVASGGELDANEELECYTEVGILCEICFKNKKKNIILKHCMHGKICKSRFCQIVERHIVNKTKTLCPICRQFVEDSFEYFG